MVLSGLIEGGAALGEVSRRAGRTGAVAADRRDGAHRRGDPSAPAHPRGHRGAAGAGRPDDPGWAGGGGLAWAAPTDPFLSRPMRKALGCRRPNGVWARRRRISSRPPAPTRPSWSIRPAWRTAGGQVALAVAAGDADARRRCAGYARGAGTALGRRRDRPGAGRPAARTRPLCPPSGADPAGRATPARNAGDRGRTLGPRPVRRLCPTYPGLKKLDRPGADAEAMARGNAMHKAIERLSLTWPEALPEDCADQIERLHARGA
jgi:ATP-dependent helicase/nuclease subunit B